MPGMVQVISAVQSGVAGGMLASRTATGQVSILAKIQPIDVNGPGKCRA